MLIYEDGVKKNTLKKLFDKKIRVYCVCEQDYLGLQSGAKYECHALTYHGGELDITSNFHIGVYDFSGKEVIIPLFSEDFFWNIYDAKKL